MRKFLIDILIITAAIIAFLFLAAQLRDLEDAELAAMACKRAPDLQECQPTPPTKE